MAENTFTDPASLLSPEKFEKLREQLADTEIGSAGLDITREEIFVLRWINRLLWGFWAVVVLVLASIYYGWIDSVRILMYGK